MYAIIIVCLKLFGWQETTWTKDDLVHQSINTSADFSQLISTGNRVRKGIRSWAGKGEWSVFVGNMGRRQVNMRYLYTSRVGPLRCNNSCPPKKIHELINDLSVQLDLFTCFIPQRKWMYINHIVITNMVYCVNGAYNFKEFSQTSIELKTTHGYLITYVCASGCLAKPSLRLDNKSSITHHKTRWP